MIIFQESCEIRAIAFETDGEFIACGDSNGNIYVQDWNFLGRITRLERLQ